MAEKILIVEDEEYSLKVFQMYLRDYELTFCRSEAEIYKNLNEQRFSLILMDIGLPGLKDGLQITKELKDSKEFSSIPVICITSYVYNEQQKNAYDAGADAYLTKPFTKNALLETIKNL